MKTQVYFILLFISITGLRPAHLHAQENITWTECFAGKQPVSWLKTKQQVAARWGIKYTWEEFYADSIQRVSHDSLVRINHHWYTCSNTHMPFFATVDQNMRNMHGIDWKTRFDLEVDSIWRGRFYSADTFCYPYSKNAYHPYESYLRDSVQRGYINLHTLTHEKDSLVPVNNFISLLKRNKNYFPERKFLKIQSTYKRSKTVLQRIAYFIEVAHNQKTYRIVLSDSANTHYAYYYNSPLSVTNLVYKNLLIVVTEPVWPAKEIIVFDMELKKIIKRIRVAPWNQRHFPLVDEVCGYQETTTISRFGNKLIVDIDVHCNENSYKDALHIIHLDELTATEFHRIF